MAGRVRLLSRALHVLQVVVRFPGFPGRLVAEPGAGAPGAGDRGDAFPRAADLPGERG